MSVKRQHMVKIKFSGRNLADLDFFTKSDPFLLLSRPSRIGPGYNQVRKTETINNNLNPDWKVLYIPLSELCDNDYNMKLKIEVFDEDSKRKSEEIGSCQLSLQEMINLSSSGAPTHIKWKMKVRGAVHVKECIVENPADPLDNRISQDSLFSRPGSMAGYPDTRQGSIAGFPGSRQGSISGFPDFRQGSVAGYPEAIKGSMSGYSQDSISEYPLPASLQLQGYPQGAGYPAGNSQGAGYPPGNPQGTGYPIGNQGSYQDPRPETIASNHPSQSDPSGYPQSQNSFGYPPSQPSGYPSSQPSGYPSSQPSGYPSSQPSGYPPSQSSGYPPSQPSGYPPSQSSGYPPSQPSGYPPSQSSGYPPQGGSGYPSPNQSFYQGQGYPPQNEMPDSRLSYVKNNPGHPFAPQ